MWLFQLLTYFPGKWEAVGSLAIPISAWCCFSPCRSWAQPAAGGWRTGHWLWPWASTAVVGIVYLTVQGFQGARPYGQIIPVPDRPLTASEERGLFLYADRECAYCHQIDGQGGHRVGPDLANMSPSAGRGLPGELHQEPAGHQAHVHHAQVRPCLRPTCDALADFVLALDFSRYPMKLLQRADALKQR